MKMDAEALKDVFVTPMSIFLGSVGMVLDTVSVFTGSISWTFATGLALLGSSVAIGVTRYFTEGEKIALNRIERDKKKKRDQEELKLEAVAAKLKEIPNKTIREHFRDLINIRNSFEETIAQEDIRSRMPKQFDESFLTLFWSSIKKLEHAARLYATAKGMTNKKSIIATASKVIDDVGENLITLTQTFEGLTEMALTQEGDGQDYLRADLQSKLDTTIATQRELSGYDPHLEERMKEYL